MKFLAFCKMAPSSFAEEVYSSSNRFVQRYIAWTDGSFNHLGNRICILLVCSVHFLEAFLVLTDAVDHAIVFDLAVVHTISLILRLPASFPYFGTSEHPLRPELQCILRRFVCSHSCARPFLCCVVFPVAINGTTYDRSTGRSPVERLVTHLPLLHT